MKFFVLSERPPILTTDGNITATPGEEVILTCHVTSNVAYTITWSRIDGEALSRVRYGNDKILKNCTRLYKKSVK